MRIRTSIILLILLISCLVVPVFAETRFYYYNSGDRTLYLTNGYNAITMTYRNISDFRVDVFSLKLTRVGNPLGYLGIRIYGFGSRSVDATNKNYSVAIYQMIDYIYESSNAIDCSIISNVTYIFYNFTFTNAILKGNITYGFALYLKNFTQITGAHEIGFQYATGSVNYVNMLSWDLASESRIYGYMLNSGLYGEPIITQESESEITQDNLYEYFTLGITLGVLTGMVMVIIFNKKRG